MSSSLVTKPGSSEFYVDKNTNGDKIEIFDEHNGLLAVEYSVRIPKDPRGWKRVVSRRGVWISSTATCAKANNDVPVTAQNYNEVIRSFSSISGIQLEGSGSAAIAFDTEKKSFIFEGKTFEWISSNGPQFAE